MPDLWVVRCATVPYEEARRAQGALAEARQAGDVPDLLLLLEHPPVYTRGRRTKQEELPMGEDWYRAQGIEVCNTDRGGAVTYHGPGQLVGYPIVSLKPYGDDVHAYVRRLEQTMIEALGAYGIDAETLAELTGVWVDADRTGSRKIGSIGVHVSRGVTTHGFAINVNNDLQPFEWIVPCGIDECRMTSVARELGGEQDLARFAETVAAGFAEIYDRKPVSMPGEELASRVAGVEALRDATPAADPAAALP
jgi:lipoyl(octanoyl) transferase